MGKTIKKQTKKRKQTIKKPEPKYNKKIEIVEQKEISVFGMHLIVWKNLALINKSLLLEFLVHFKYFNGVRICLP